MGQVQQYKPAYSEDVSQYPRDEGMTREESQDFMQRLLNSYEEEEEYKRKRKKI